MAAISGTLLNKETLRSKARISIASDCDLMLQNPSKSRALSAESGGLVPVRLPAAAPGNHSACFRVRWVSATVATRVYDIVWLLVLVFFLSVSLTLSPLS